MAENLHVDKSEHIAVVGITQPTMKPSFFYEVRDTFRELGADPEVRAIILRSDVKPFTYGLDLAAAASEMGELFAGGGAGQRIELLERIRELQACFDAVASCPAPVIAAVHGWCIGGGVDLISACDIRLASADAKLSVRETKIAIVADLGTLQRLPTIIGDGRTRELAFTGRDVDAERAAQIGLVNEVFPDRDSLYEGARALASEIAQNPPLTVRGTKEVLNFARHRQLRDGLEYVAAWNSAFLASEDLGEAMAAFMEKRPPKYRGR